jgi:hypothetical protein
MSESYLIVDQVVFYTILVDGIAIRAIGIQCLIQLMAGLNSTIDL